jgi:hypothetical protein
LFKIIEQVFGPMGHESNDFEAFASSVPNCMNSALKICVTDNPFVDTSNGKMNASTLLGSKSCQNLKILNFYQYETNRQTGFFCDSDAEQNDNRLF